MLFMVYALNLAYVRLFFNHCSFTEQAKIRQKKTKKNSKQQNTQACSFLCLSSVHISSTHCSSMLLLPTFSLPFEFPSSPLTHYFLFIHFTFMWFPSFAHSFAATTLENTSFLHKCIGRGVRHQRPKQIHIVFFCCYLLNMHSTVMITHVTAYNSCSALPEKSLCH